MGYDMGTMAYAMRYMKPWGFSWDGPWAPWPILWAPWPIPWGFMVYPVGMLMGSMT